MLPGFAHALAVMQFSRARGGVSGGPGVERPVAGALNARSDGSNVRLPPRAHYDLTALTSAILLANVSQQSFVSFVRPAK